MTYDYLIMESPVGKLKLIANNQQLIALLWSNEKRSHLNHIAYRKNKENLILRKTEKELWEYFEHKRKVFTIPCAPIGTDFQKKTWKALQKIPYGKTISYNELARQTGNPKAARAVGSANGKNPISIIIPCHRVIRKSGDLGGFAGGLQTKQYLLDLEK